HTSFDFLGKRRLALVLSTAVNILSLLAVAFVGLNFGIDFKGGIAIQVRAQQGAAHLDEVRGTAGGLGGGGGSVAGVRDPSAALIRVQRQDGSAQCVANAERVLKRRAGEGWSAKPGAADTGDVEFTAPNALDAAGWRDAVSRVGLTILERQLPRGTVQSA